MMEGGRRWRWASVLKDKTVFLLPAAVSPALVPAGLSSPEEVRGGRELGDGDLGDGDSRTTYLRHLSK